MAERVEADRGLLDGVLRAHLELASGTLEFEVAGRSRRLHFAGGELHLSTDSPFAAAVRELGDSASAERWAPLLARLVEAYLAAGAVHGLVWRAATATPAGAVGPLPTEALLRRAFASVAATPAPVGELVADAGEHDRAGAPSCWTHEESWVLERLRRPQRYAELRRDCPFPEPQLRAVLAGLTAVGRLRDPQRAPSAPHDSGLLRLNELLAARIGASLREHPLGLLDDALRRRLEALQRSADSLSHYELLGVATDADDGAIQAAFETLARLVHPVHAERASLGFPRAALGRLFERAVAAYRTLGDPALRASYDDSHGISRPVGEAPAPERHAEVEQMARHEFDRAGFEELNGDLHTALTLYERAVELAPRVEYLLALARLEAKNPAWTSRALATCRRALELAPASAEACCVAGELYERAGEPERAAGYYQVAASQRPPYPAAQAALRRLAARGIGGPSARDGGGPLGRLFRRS